MKKMFPKLLSLVLTLVMCFSMLNLTAYAESGGTVWYGDQLSVNVTAGTEGYTFMSLFRKPASGYEFGGHFLANETTQEGAQTFVVIDTVAHDGTTWSPSGRYAPNRSNYDVTYCCDIDTMMRDGTYYKRLNLEDSEYFNDVQAAKIRAIVTNSYPYVTLEAMKADLAEDGFENADKLTRGEIIAAVQTAIWACANSMEPLKYVKSYRVTDNYGWGQPLHDISDEAGLDVAGNRVFKTYPEVGARIDALVEYLLAQDADYASKAQIVITELKIEDEVAILDEENQIYRVPLTLVMNNSGSGYDDNINIRVTAGESEIVIPVVYGQKTYNMEVTAKPGDVIKAVVSGTQVLPKGVYFYSPKPADVNGDGVATGREVSQNMVGVAMGKTEVYAEDSVAFEELEIHVPVHTPGSVIVTKNAPVEVTPADTAFQLQKLDGETWINVGEPVMFAGFVDNVYAFTDLEEGTYRVVESGAEVENYNLTTTYSEDVVLTMTTARNGDTTVSSGSIVVTNDYHLPVHTQGSIVVSKNAIGASTPADATFQLQKQNGEEWTNVGAAVAFSDFADNAYTFENLEEGTYRVVESNAEVSAFNLTTTYSDDVVLTKITADNGDTTVDNGAIFVTNTYTEIYQPVHTKGSIVVTKNATGAETPEDTTFQLQKKEGDEWINVGEAIAFSKFANNAYNFTDLEEGTYRVVESDAEVEGFILETTYSADVALTKTTSENGDTSVSSGNYTVTNKYEEIEEEEDDELIEIPDEDVPLADVPKTGDMILPFFGMAIASGVAAIFVGKNGKKEDEE